ncbi:glucoamylase [Phenylobacterium sp. Root77]|jgi:GH15 family glucan-1,4-alpha-glucosidase|uniref:glycoside hydrolase family 15 protein n=1 Tax=unclassified Phenylobacterium TaxID=2640670 RepID=UPI0006FE25FD|nr:MULTISPECIES: glycoside hydrolase family 15 protein [unclassified Phenylobacterium]KQW66014.1 glucoamylase [Phenylobacterium sp. Root1277]KQW95723.1 glucoamylase [Phenylobacterium sp. Root1290]KRC41512.1 glucoamylase [Phenylobacterium sp. Root77]
MTQTLDLFPIGNCAASGLIDRAGRLVWACAPRVDGDPMFCALLGEEPDASPDVQGFWDIQLENQTKVEQRYLRNTPIVSTLITDDEGAVAEVIDFCPRYRQFGRIYRPLAIIRMVRPISGTPKVRIRARPMVNWGERAADRTTGSNHIRFVGGATTLRLTTDAPVSHITSERLFRLEKPVAMFLGPDEGFDADLGATCERMLSETTAYWRGWVRTLSVPLEWQEAVIRSAITLKLCAHEETGAIVAALTTSIPEHAESGRNWDYRYCWLRDAYYVVQALNRLGAADMLENYLAYLRNLIDRTGGGHVQPLYGVGMEPSLTEHFAEHLPGYRGMGPVRIGNQAHEHLQHDVYGQIVLSTVQAFFDERLLRPATIDDFHALEQVGDRAFEMHDQPDASLWEFRGRESIHTYSAVMCWAACDRLGNAAAKLGLTDRAEHWNARAAQVRATIESRAWNSKLGRFAATFGGDELDASLLQLVDVRFVRPDDPRMAATIAAVEKGLRRGPYMLRYAIPDDFGEPKTAFNICTFWLIEALYLSGRSDEARQLFEEMLERRTAAGLLSEDIAFDGAELWGNYPQTYSLVGLINCATMLSRPWASVR